MKRHLRPTAANRGIWKASELRQVLDGHPDGQPVRLLGPAGSHRRVCCIAKMGVRYIGAYTACQACEDRAATSSSTCSWVKVMLMTVSLRRVASTWNTSRRSSQNRRLPVWSGSSRIGQPGAGPKKRTLHCASVGSEG